MTLPRALPLLLLAASPLAAQPSPAREVWHEVIRGDDGTTVSIDSATIGHTRTSAFLVRTAIRFPEPMRLANGRTVDHEIDLEELDCAAARSRGVASGLYADTTVVTAVALSKAWAPVAENRKGVFDASCAWLLGSFAAALPTGYPLSAVDEEPVLLDAPVVAAALSREYPSLLKDAGVIGEVTLRFRIAADGGVDLPTVAIVATTRAEFSRAARNVVPVMLFRAARVAGEAVPVWVEMPLTFSLQAPPGTGG